VQWLGSGGYTISGEEALVWFPSGEALPVSVFSRHTRKWCPSLHNTLCHVRRPQRLCKCLAPHVELDIGPHGENLLARLPHHMLTLMVQQPPSLLYFLIALHMLSSSVAWLGLSF
jgi:hypothetical protein